MPVIKPSTRYQKQWATHGCPSYCRAGRWELHLLGSFAIKIVLDSTQNKPPAFPGGGESLKDGFPPLAPAGCGVLCSSLSPTKCCDFQQEFSAVPVCASLVHQILVANPRAQVWQCSLTLVPLALQQLVPPEWNLLLLRDAWMLPSDPQTQSKHWSNTPRWHSVKLLPVLCHKMR